MPLSPLSHPFYVMAKPVGSSCNLRCHYCYYSPRDKAPARMSASTLEMFIREYIEMQTTDSVLFTWHGGEPTLCGLDFYQEVVRLQRRYADGRQVDNALQTNGTLLTPEWCRFLRDEGWLVGLSLDGPEHLHDAYRLDAEGRGTHAAVLRAAALLCQFDVEWNAMATVNQATASEPQAFYRFFKQIGCQYLQFTPVVERWREDAPGRLAAPDEPGTLAPYSVTPEAWGSFLCTLFDEWVSQDVGRVFVQLFDATLAGWMGVEPGVCTLARTCGHAAVIEADGSVYACDHFVFPGYRLGRLSPSSPLLSLLTSERQRTFGQDKQRALTRQCRRCPWLFACHGECPRCRFAVSDEGEFGQNYLCAGYRRFFEHAAPAMDFMRHELLAGRPPANVMRVTSFLMKNEK